MSSTNGTPSLSASSFRALARNASPDNSLGVLQHAGLSGLQAFISPDRL